MSPMRDGSSNSSKRMRGSSPGRPFFQRIFRFCCAIPPRSSGALSRSTPTVPPARGRSGVMRCFLRQHPHLNPNLLRRQFLRPLRRARRRLSSFRARRQRRLHLQRPLRLRLFLRAYRRRRFFLRRQVPRRLRRTRRRLQLFRVRRQRRFRLRLPDPASLRRMHRHRGPARHQTLNQAPPGCRRQHRLFHLRSKRALNRTQAVMRPEDRWSS